MARATTRTWLSLDRFAQIIGLNPLFFNQLSSNTLFQSIKCGEIFFQEDWQHADRIGRETIARTIQQAELAMAREAGYNLMPDWTLDERMRYPHPAVAGVYGSTLNPYGYNKSIELGRGQVISGGIRTKTLIEAGAAVTRQDDDTDDYDETCVVNSTVTITDADEIRVYYPGKEGADAWEIRPITVRISGGVANIQFKSWQIAAANQMDAIDAQPLDAHDDDSYETTVDVYRVYNDPSTQCQFMWEYGTCGTCTACQFGTQGGCFHLRNPRMGVAVPTPGTWDADDEEFDTVKWSVCREPDQVRFWYYSGYRDMQMQRPLSDLAPYWEYAVAVYAASLFDRPVCGCTNVSNFIEEWRADISFSDQSGSYVSTPEMLANKLGSTKGAVYAWKRIQQNGMKVNK